MYNDVVTWPVSTNLLRSFALVAGVTMAFTIVACGVAHVVSAHLAQELYDIAIGDRILPDPPVYSWIGGPLWIAVYVTWWFGLAAAPVVYAIAGGPRTDLRLARVAVAAAIGLAASALVMLAVASFNPAWRDRWGDAVLVSILDYGYWALGIGLLTMAFLLRRRVPVAT